MTRSQKKPSQVERFRDAARAVEADEDESKFNEALRRVAKTPPPKDERKHTKPS